MTHRSPFMQFLSAAAVQHQNKKKGNRNSLFSSEKYIVALHVL
jgi:hypothetical protein